MWDIVQYFKEVYQNRRNNGLIIEKPNSLYSKINYNETQIAKNIITNPVNEFVSINVLEQYKELKIVGLNSDILEQLNKKRKNDTLIICDQKL